MRRSQRLIATAVLLSLTGALAGCTGGMNSFDPTDMFDFLDTKKKLPGHREPVFPQGVPGVEQGVPQDLYKDNVERQQQLQQQGAAMPPPAAAPEPPPAAAPPPRSHSRARPAAPRQPASTTSDAGSRATAPSDAHSSGHSSSRPRASSRGISRPSRRTIHRRSTTVPEAELPARQSAPAQQTESTAPAAGSSSPFPAPLPSGSFQR